MVRLPGGSAGPVDICRTVVPGTASWRATVPSEAARVRSGSPSVTEPCTGAAVTVNDAVSPRCTVKSDGVSDSVKSQTPWLTVAELGR